MAIFGPNCAACAMNHPGRVKLRFVVFSSNRAKENSRTRAPLHCPKPLVLRFNDSDTGNLERNPSLPPSHGLAKIVFCSLTR